MGGTFTHRKAVQSAPRCAGSGTHSAFVHNFVEIQWKTLWKFSGCRVLLLL